MTVSSPSPTSSSPSRQPGTARLSRIGRFAVVTIVNPPANALSLEVRTQIAEAVRAVRYDPRVEGLVIVGSQKAFCSGADIRQFGTPSYWAEPRTRDLVALIDDIGKPVVAAIGGFAMGGGLELAMAAHFRVALPQSLLGLPEVRLGVIPAAGGILRLPRLVGTRRALDMMMSGESIDAVEAHRIGLIDELAQGELVASALGLLTRYCGRDDLVRTIDRQIADTDEEICRAFEAHPSEQSALSRDPARCALLACVRATLTQPSGEADEITQEYSKRLVESPEARALRYVFFGRRSVSKSTAFTGLAPTPVERVAVLGDDQRAEAVRQKAHESGLLVANECDADLVFDLDTRHPQSPGKARVSATSRNAPAPVDHDVEILLSGPETLPALMEYSTAGPCPPETLAAVALTGRRLGMVSVPVRRLGVGERLWARMCETARALVTETVSATAINAALAIWGFRKLPLEGHSHDPGQLTVQERAGVVMSCVEALVAEGERMLAEGEVEAPIAIDMIMVCGYGFPATLGGPLYSSRHAILRLQFNQASIPLTEPRVE